MKKLYAIGIFFTFLGLNAQTPLERVYTILNTKCQNSSCHSSTATDGSEMLRFDYTTQSELWDAIYNVAPGNASSLAKNEKLVKPQHPYYSFLLRKIAGASFDTDLALDASEGAVMNDIYGQPLSNKEIEFVRQWIMFGAKKTYSGGFNPEPQPKWNVISAYYDNPAYSFLPKPAKPAPGAGVQLRMGPIFLDSSDVEQEWLQQQEVNFPYPVEINRIDGFMNQQSHHFLLFKFISLNAANQATNDRNSNMSLVSLIGGNTAYDGDKILTSAWQDDGEMHLPQGTALFWDQNTVLDMNYHTKNYNATSVLPCDFYFNVYFKPRNQTTIEMKAELVNNVTLFLPGGGATSTRDYDSPINNDNQKEVRYLWNLTSHAHKYSTDYDIYVRDTTGVITDKIYEGFLDYQNGGVDKGYYDWEHPSTRVWSDLYPVHFGKHNGNNSGLVARTTWTVNQTWPVTFGFTTSDEMQLFTYFYTSALPDISSSVSNNGGDNIYFQVMPNPMNGNGRLVYTLDKTTKVEASIIDVTGKVVTSLAEQNQDAGVHQIAIGSEELSTGIYFARLSLNGVVYTKKFIVTE